MKVTELTNWAYERIYAPGAENNWQTISQEAAMKKSNKFIKWVIEASKPAPTKETK